VWSTVSLDHVLAVAGHFLQSGEQFVVFNVYAPCDSSRQQVLGMFYPLELKLWRTKMFVCVVILMLFVVWRKEEVLVVSFPRQAPTTLTFLLPTTYWWTFRSGVALTCGIGEMGGWWVILIVFCYLKIGVWLGLIVSRWLCPEGCLITAPLDVLLCLICLFFSWITSRTP